MRNRGGALQRTVLIVDDQVEVRAAFARLFTRLGWALIQAGNGPCAAAALRQMTPRIPDMIVSDVDMPGGGGVEFAETIARDYPDYSGRIVFHSGAAVGDAARAVFCLIGAKVLLKHDSFLAIKKMATEESMK